MFCKLPDEHIKTVSIFLSFVSALMCILLLTRIAVKYQSLILMIILLCNTFVIAMYQTNGQFNKSTFDAMTNFQKFTVVFNTFVAFLMLLMVISTGELFSNALGTTVVDSTGVVFKMLNPDYVLLMVIVANACNLSFICHE